MLRLQQDRRFAGGGDKVARAAGADDECFTVEVVMGWRRVVAQAELWVTEQRYRRFSDNWLIQAGEEAVARDKGRSLPG